MDGREALYLGTHDLKRMVPGERKEETPHVRNICAELIEAQADSNIPQPKVTAVREGDELLAKLIEDMLRNELDRLPFERLNDIMERTVPIQGGGAFLVEWDNSRRTHFTIGELAVSSLHPKQIVPQDGVYSGIEDMDYIIIKVPQTKAYIKRRYGVELEDERESEPSIKSVDGTAADDLVTQYMAYYRNDKGGIGLYSWVNDTELEDLEDYQARRLKRCAVCGAAESPEGRQENGKTVCPQCGGTVWEEREEEFEELPMPVARTDGSTVGGMRRRFEPSETERDAEGRLPMPMMVEEAEKIPYYKPNIYPVILQKNVSIFGKFLGDSDIDKIADQQNTTNRIEAKIIDKLVKSGSYITLPKDAAIRIDAEDGKPIRLESPADKAMIEVYDMQGNVSQDMAYLAQVYEEARQLIGITDSFQGRADRTATSGKAKEFAAAQSAGRLESKRVMKDAAYAALFEAMFKFKLAYADEPREVVSKDIYGNKVYSAFNRYDFLEKDAAGEWCWNDRFLFSCDTSAPLASNREAMWQETRMNLSTGAFGDPSNIETLILFWTKMELLHYPGAGETRSYLEERLERQQQAAAIEQAMKESQESRATYNDMAMAEKIEARARADAARDATNGAAVNADQIQI